MKGVSQFRKNYGEASLDLRIFSASYGIIPGSRPIVPYEYTFQSMKAGKLRQ
ncbi:hypothetical protein [Desulforhabdus sp. TSK]|uniref:hypothetical protein n=1 Tax=Desulforhabdus sp. TSK TaxID=2925014 RepID=UPI001FC862D1|nr:hypothetical protein [Desulforhabdus sp. TSK]GKT09171.1 hypothetical protein DSTSK_24760 [Desulforhabdus sp. TSK]